MSKNRFELKENDQTIGAAVEYQKMQDNIAAYVGPQKYYLTVAGLSTGALLAVLIAAATGGGLVVAIPCALGIALAGYAGYTLGKELDELKLQKMKDDADEFRDYSDLTPPKQVTFTYSKWLTTVQYEKAKQLIKDNFPSEIKSYCLQTTDNRYRFMFNQPCNQALFNALEEVTAPSTKMDVTN